MYFLILPNNLSADFVIDPTNFSGSDDFTIIFCG